MVARQHECKHLTNSGTLTDVRLSSDFITGFCGETEAEHEDTVDLMRRVRYDMAFMFAYSMREVSEGTWPSEQLMSTWVRQSTSLGQADIKCGAYS